MRPLGQLLLDVHVDLDVLLQLLDLLLVVVVLSQQRLGLFGLKLKLLRQLAILHDGQPRRSLLLLIVQRAQVGLGLLDFDFHFLPQLLSGMHAVTVHLRLRLVVLLDLIGQLLLEINLLLLKSALLALGLLNLNFVV